MLKQVFNYICLDIYRIRLPGWWLSCSLGGMAGEWTWTPETFGRRFLGICCNMHMNIAIEYEWTKYICVQRTLLSWLHPPWRLDGHGRKTYERANWLVCHQTWACGWVHCWAHQKSLHVRHHPTQAFCCGLEAKTSRCALPFSSHWSQKGGDFYTITTSIHDFL